MMRLHACICGKSVVRDMMTHIHVTNTNDIRVSMTHISGRCTGCGRLFDVPYNPNIAPIPRLSGIIASVKP